MFKYITSFFQGSNVKEESACSDGNCMISTSIDPHRTDNNDIINSITTENNEMRYSLSTERESLPTHTPISNDLDSTSILPTQNNTMSFHDSNSSTTEEHITTGTGNTINDEIQNMIQLSSNLNTSSDRSNSSSNVSNSQIITGYTDDELKGGNIHTLFVVGQTWVNRTTLLKNFQDYCNIHDTPTVVTGECGNTIACKRHGLSRSSKNRPFSTGNMKLQCPFRLRMKSTKYKKKTSSAGIVSYRPNYDDDIPVIIKEHNLEHGNGCCPSPQQSAFLNRRSGEYIRNANKIVLYEICDYQRRQGRVPSNFIRHVLQRQFPEYLNVTKHDVFHLRIRCQRLIPKLSSDVNFEKFKEIVSHSDIPPSIKYDVTLNNEDEACAVAKSIWDEILNNTDTGDSESIALFQTYLHMLSLQAKGFSYQLSYDNEGRVTGAVWMTATMRSNFERFGSYIALDAMKRGLNTLLWPYLAITMLNELKQVCVACEAVMIGERIDAYKFMITFLSNNAPGRLLKDIYVVTGDGFFTQSNVRNILGLTNAHLIQDHYHLFDSGLKHRFGKATYSILKDDLLAMANAFSEEAFELSFSKAMSVLQTKQGGRDLSLENELKTFADERDTYAVYMLKTFKATMGRLGSVSAEQNNSSVVIYLNDGNKGLNDYQQHLHILITDLMGRQQRHINKWNEQLFGNTNIKTHINVELNRLPNSWSKTMKIEALQHLCLQSYRRFEMHIDRAATMLESRQCLVNGKTCYEVFDKRYPESPRLFETTYSRCNCSDAIAMMEMCPHEIFLLQTFQIDYYDICHHTRSHVTGSTVGWNRPIEYINENTEQFTSMNSESMIDNTISDTASSNTTVPDNHHSQISQSVGTQSSEKVMKPMSANAFADIMQEIVYSYRKRQTSDKIKFVLGGVLIAMHKLITKGNTSTNQLLLQGIDDVQSEDSIIEIVKSIKRTYDLAFDSTPKHHSSVDVPSSDKRMNQPRKRLKKMDYTSPSTRSKTQQSCQHPALPALSSVRHTIQRQRKCKFCSEVGHNISTCPKREAFRHQYKELAKSDDKSNIITRLDSISSFSVMNDSSMSSIVENLTKEQMKSHTIIHHVFCKECSCEHAKQDKYSR